MSYRLKRGAALRQAFEKIAVLKRPRRGRPRKGTAAYYFNLMTKEKK